MAPHIEELRRLFDAARRYLDGESSVHELNGIASICIELARQADVSPQIVALLGDWREMINRRWNEWGLVKEPVSEAEFLEWLREQLVFAEDRQ